MFGLVEVTLSVPVVKVYRFAMPRIALVDNCRDVPLSVTLNKLAVPFNVLVPVNVAVPAEAVKLPLTSKELFTEKEDEAVIVPDTFRANRVIPPAPVMVLEIPVKLIMPKVEVRLPVTDKLPARVRLLVVLMLPVQFRLSKIIPAPEIVLEAPLMVKVPGELCTSEPAPVVVKFPPTVIFVPAVTELPDAGMVKLLKP